MSYFCKLRFFSVIFMLALMLAVMMVPLQAQAQQNADEYYQMMLDQAKERMGKIQSGDISGAVNGDTVAGAQSLASYGAGYGHDRMATAEIIQTEPLVKGQENEITIRLTYEDDGAPLPIGNLQVIHTKPLHLLVVEPQLNDYHHIHPQPTDVAGEYKFTINPETDCHYRAWADILPIDGPEQNTWADIKGARSCDDTAIQETKNMTARHNGYQYAISMDTEELAYDQDTLLTVDVMDEDGQAVTDLQPVMGTFAHLIGFFKDYETIAHIHPLGDEISDPAARGGPSLRFHVKPEKSGYARFYLQTLIDDEMQFVPFGMVIAEEGPYSGQNRMSEIMGAMDEYHPPAPSSSAQTNNPDAGLSEAHKERFRKVLQESDVEMPEALRDMLE